MRTDGKKNRHDEGFPDENGREEEEESRKRISDGTRLNSLCIPTTGDCFFRNHELSC
uniref:Uncharacterized protein n=1 Tax=Arion vulgaris TaxID=1028688 RepID=A0A0B6Y1N9_9EUPU